MTPALAPHSIYTVSESSLRWIAELSAERELPVQIHLAETEREVEDCVAAHGVRPAAYLDRLGLLGMRTVLAHGGLVRPGGAGAGRGARQHRRLQPGREHEAGGRPRLPLSGGAGGRCRGRARHGRRRLQRFARPARRPEALRAGPEARRHRPDRISAGEAWEIATGARAPLLGAGQPLAVGARADFLLLRPDTPALAIGELASDLVYAASAADLDTVVAGGELLMHGGELPEVEEIVARAAERARRLGL